MSERNNKRIYQRIRNACCTEHGFGRHTDTNWIDAPDVLDDHAGRITLVVLTKPNVRKLAR